MAVFEWRARVKLDAEGSLSGTVTVKVHGLGGMAWREEFYGEDEVKRREEMEKRMKDWLPEGATVDVTGMSGWEQNDYPLVVEASVRVPGFAVGTGRRLFLPTGIFQTQEIVSFEHAQRQYPVYFRFPWQEKDAVELTLPEGVEVEALPQEKNRDTALGRYRFTCRHQEQTVRIERELVINGFFFQTQYYPALRDFFNQVRTSDEQHAISSAEKVAQRD